MMTGY
jgi:hypothetical protein